MFIVELEGETLREFIDFVDRNRQGEHREIYRLRVAVDGDHLKAKINERMWTPPLGPVTVVTPGD